MKKYPKTPSFNLSGKKALVTGSSSGIGLGAAIALAEHGAKVFLAARNIRKLKEVRTYIESKGYSAEIVSLDLTKITETAEKIEALGPFDILLNSAGQARHSKAIETKTEDFDAIIDINLKGAYFLTQAVAKGLIATKQPGSLINISSQMAHVGGIDRAVYCASKFAVEGFTKAMAMEFAQYQIRVNTICPTFILTPLTQKTFDDIDKRNWIVEKIKLGRVGNIEDIMGAVIYLSSDASSLVTGSSMMVDGGWTIG